MLARLLLIETVMNRKVCIMVLMVAAGWAAAAADAMVAADYPAPSEPAIVDVQAAALEHHGLDRGEAREWKKRARLSALLPRLELRYDRRVKDYVDVNVTENVYVGSSGVTVGPNEGKYSQNSNNDQNIGVRAVWQLGGIVFNTDQLAISREARSLMHERMTLTAQVNKHYHERRRLIGIIDELERGILSHGMKGTPQHELFLARVRLAEETAFLDGLTGGWFSRNLRR